MVNTVKKRKLIEKTVRFKDFKKEYLKDKEMVALYLNEALAQKNIVFFRECLLEAIKINGGISELAKIRLTSRQNIHRSLSGKGGLKIETISEYLEYVNLKLKIEKVV